MDSGLILQLLLSTATSASSITVSPPFNYTTFVSNISTIAFNCTGAGFVLFWIVDGNAHYTQPVLQRGIRTLPLTAASGYVSSLLVIPTTAINNNTNMVCKVFDFTLSVAQYSPPQYLRLQGTLDAPHNFSVTISNISNTTFIFSWGAPFSLHVSDYPSDIFYYTLCCSISIYGCRIIPSDPDCTFPRTCISMVDLTSPISNEGQQITVIDQGVPIQFILFAVNGAGNGEKTVFLYLSSKAVLSSTTIPETIFSTTFSTIPPSTIAPTRTLVSNSGKTSSMLIFLYILPGAALMVCAMITGVACLCVHCRKKLKGAENPSHHATNKMVHCIIENMEPCPAYAQIHMHVYDNIHS